MVSGLDITNGKWRFVWWITIPTSADVERLNTVSNVQTPFKTVGRNSELECRLREASPAHTHLVIEYNSIPSLPALPDLTLAQDVQVTLPQATGGDTPLTYSVTGLPTDVTFNANLRRLRTRTTSPLGTFTLTYTVEDDDGDTDSQTFELTVTT